MLPLNAYLKGIRHGTSFLMAVELGRDGPSGRQILTYSQSADPNLVTYRVGERR